MLMSANHVFLQFCKDSYFFKKKANDRAVYWWNWWGSQGSLRSNIPKWVKQQRGMMKLMYWRGSIIFTLTDIIRSRIKTRCEGTAIIRPLQEMSDLLTCVCPDTDFAFFAISQLLPREKQKMACFVEEVNGLNNVNY